jgi:hypothetical protein
MNRFIRLFWPIIWVPPTTLKDPATISKRSLPSPTSYNPLAKIIPLSTSPKYHNFSQLETSSKNISEEIIEFWVISVEWRVLFLEVSKSCPMGVWIAVFWVSVQEVRVKEPSEVTERMVEVIAKFWEMRQVVQVRWAPDSMVKRVEVMPALVVKFVPSNLKTDPVLTSTIPALSNATIFPSKIPPLTSTIAPL